MILQSYTTEEALNENAAGLRDFLHHMGREARQGAVGPAPPRYPATAQTD